jgi:hypothetical protein
VAGGGEAAEDAEDGGGGAALGLGIAGTVLGLAGLVFAFLAYRKASSGGATA